MYVLKEGRIVEGLSQGSAEWLHLRRTTITSTDIAAAIPKAGDTQNALSNFLVSKNAATTDLSGNIKVQKGKEFEPIILQKFIRYQFSLGEKLPQFNMDSFQAGQVWVRDVEFTDAYGNNKTNTLLSSHDGYIEDMDGNGYILEAKCSAENYNYKQDYVLPRYLKQIAHHLLVNEKAVGCYLIIHDGGERVICHYLDRDHIGIKGVIGGILRIATSVSWKEPEPNVIFWSSTKTEEELRQEFVGLAYELAKVHVESKGLLEREKELQNNIKAAPYAATCTARFDEFGLDVKLEMVSKKELAIDKYIQLLEKELTVRDIGLPSKLNCLYTMNYQVLKVVKST